MLLKLYQLFYLIKISIGMVEKWAIELTTLQNLLGVKVGNKKI